MANLTTAGQTRRRARLATGVSAGALMALIALISPMRVMARSVTEPTSAPAATPTTQAVPAEPIDAEADPTVEEVVVTSRRRQVGAVMGDIKPEIQLGRTTVQAYGVGNVVELLTELAPQLRSEKGRLSADAIVLLNGLPVTGMEEIRDIPSEAIQRVDILPEDVALKYGYAPDQRVLNLVLRHRFHESVIDMQGRLPTDGGRESGQFEFDIFRAHGVKRFNLDVKYQETAGLTEAQRGLTPFPTRRPYDVIGNIIAATGSGEIDPALSALAGRTITVAGVPATLAAGNTPTLADFGPTAGVANITDVRSFESLAPATRQASANLAFATPLPGAFTASIDAGASISHSLWRDGLAGVRLTVQANDPFSPFGSDFEIDRYAPSAGVLKRVTNAWTGHLAGGLVRDVGAWRLDVTAAYDHAETHLRKDAGIDPSAMQALLDALDPTVNPFGPLVGLVARPLDIADSRLDVANVQLLASGPLIRVPAGVAFGSLRVGDAESLLDGLSVRTGLAFPGRVARHDASARASVDVPLSRSDGDRLHLGELWLNANGGVEDVSGFGALTSVGGGLNWTPVTGARLIASAAEERAAPTVQQLGDPQYTINRSPVLDFATGQTIDVHRVLGGNSALAAEDRRAFNLGVQLKPMPDRDLTLTANYTDALIHNPIETFPAATTALRRAFPDRFTTDASGLLAQIDVRPLNFASEHRRDLRWGINFIAPFGSKPPEQPGAGPARHAPSSSFEGGRLQLAIYHTVFFQDDQLVRVGGPRLNLLGGDPANAFGGQPRHEIEALAGVARNGMGLRLNGDWLAGTAVRDASGLPASQLSFSPVLRFDARVFANLESVPGFEQRYPWLRGSRLTLSVTNLFDERVQVRDATGATPLAYQAAYLDPIGRTFRIGFRKVF